MTYLLLEDEKPSICVWTFDRATRLDAIRFEPVSEIYRKMVDLIIDPYLVTL